ncbi:3-keto-5-aminohexanoate cleavage protein [Virgibacillus sp. FSP13]
MEKLIITIATTGAVTTKGNTPYLPTTPTEIAEEVYESWKAGASIAHIHIRDDDGNPSMNYEKFKETVKLIKERCDIIINWISIQHTKRAYPYS